MMNGPAKKIDLLPKKDKPDWMKRAQKIYKGNMFLLVSAIIIATVLWSILVASDGTLTREKTFQNVEVSVIGADTLKTNSFIVVDDTSSVIPTVKLTVEVSQANYSRVTGTYFSPRIDVSKIRSAGEQEIEITFGSTAYGKVISCEPSSIKVNVERYSIRSRVPVVAVPSGTLSDDIYYDTLRLDPTYVSVSGPLSLVSTISRAVADFNVEALDGSVQTQRNTASFILENAKGEAIDSPLLSVSYQSVFIDSLIVEADVYPVSAIPIETDGVYIGEPGEGYEVKGITLSPDSVRIASTQQVLDAMESIVLDAPIDISDATSTQSITARIKKPSDAKNINISEVLVTVEIGEKTSEKTLRRVPIEIQGVTDDMSAKLSASQSNVQLLGPYHFINDLTADNVQLYVDLEGLAVGEHTLPVQCRIDNAPEFSCALSITSVKVTIDQK